MENFIFGAVILDVWLGSEYTSVSEILRFKVDKFSMQDNTFFT